MAVSALYFQFTIWLPPARVWPHQDAFETLLNSSWRIWLAAGSKYLLSQYFDLWSFLKLEETWLGRKSLTFEPGSACWWGNSWDTVVFITIAFARNGPARRSHPGQNRVKVAFTTISAPMVYVAVKVGLVLEHGAITTNRPFGRRISDTRIASEPASWLAVGIPEPSDAGIRIRCLTTWLRPNRLCGLHTWLSSGREQSAFATRPAIQHVSAGGAVYDRTEGLVQLLRWVLLHRFRNILNRGLS